jgi:hypothetical protein
MGCIILVNADRSTTPQEDRVQFDDRGPREDIRRFRLGQGKRHAMHQIRSARPLRPYNEHTAPWSCRKEIEDMPDFGVSSDGTVKLTGAGRFGEVLRGLVPGKRFVEGVKTQVPGRQLSILIARRTKLLAAVRALRREVTYR